MSRPAFLRGLGRRVGDIFFAVGTLAWRCLGWVWKWLALPASSLLAVGVGLSRDPWLGAAIASSLFVAVLVYAMLLQREIERLTAAGRRHDEQARDK